MLDIYLADALSTEEYAAKKQSLISEKVSLSEKISDFEQRGLSWLEPAREFIKSLNQAANLLSSPNPSEMTTFLKNIGSNHVLRNRQFVFTPKIEYKLVAESLLCRDKLHKANPTYLQFSTWCPGWDSNPQSLRQRILSPPCIPFHHPGIYNLRREAELNRRTGFCRPLPNHSAIAPLRYFFSSSFPLIWSIISSIRWAFAVCFSPIHLILGTGRIFKR